ncbi:MAG: hypothetical protein RIB52_10340 [Erythrobacter sp.]|uniref:hypothetical protein n=1 Tax=Erythrobacter sp. TaxID=1042 RepID=UPI0032EB27EF
MKARDLLLLGGVRGRFDTGRVVDRTAWRAVIAAQRSIFGPLDEDKSEQLTDAMSKLEDHAAIITMCERMVALGAPEYFPAYMIDHGVEAAADRIGKEALDPDFKATEAWPRAVGDYFRCDEAQEKVNAGQAQ